MTDLVSLVTGAVFLLFGTHRWFGTRATRTDPAQRYIAGFAWCVGTAMLCNTPAATGILAGAAGLDSMVLLLTHELKTAAFGFLVLVAVAVRTPPPGRGAALRQLLVAAVVLTASAVLFWTADVEMTAGTLSAPGERRWLLAAYNALFACYGAWCLLVLAAELLRHARRTGPGTLRTGLRLMVLAALSATAWTLWALDDVAGNLATGGQGVGEDAVSAVLGAVSAVLAAAGASVTLWSGPAGAPLRRLRAGQRLRALRPLWSQLHAQLPQIALDAPAAGRRGAGPRGAEFALYRRVIEIRDGYLALRPYFDDGALDRLTVVLDDARPTAPVREAAMIAVALENLAAGRRPPPGAAPAAEGISAVAGTVEAEAGWLAEVSRALVGSPVVAAARRAARTGAAGAPGA